MYLSLEAETAVEELRRTAEREGASLSEAHPCSLLVVQARLTRLVDLTDPNTLAAWRLTGADLKDEDMERCREAARAMAQAGAEGVLWPSATGRGRSLAIFADQLVDGSQMTVLRAHELTCTMLDAIEQGVPVSEVIASISEV